MRFDRSQGRTAEYYVNHLDLGELARTFTLYADEKKSLYIAQAILAARKIKPITTTKELLDIIYSSSFDPKSPIRVFQALRILVNAEFDHITCSLESAISLLAPGGQIAVITFHSIEDRIVKNIFAPYLIGTIDEITGQTIIPPRLQKTTKKPIEPTADEIHRNPRSRSAKLRVVERPTH
jgi:16S rRNA (cytosine1402-N4)-methyltransferase